MIATVQFHGKERIPDIALYFTVDIEFETSSKHQIME